MKVLYIGNYRDGTGWAQAAIDGILSLNAAGVDVVPRHVKLNNVNAPVPNRIAELEKKSSKGCDVVIQHLLPHMMDYNGRMLNIGVFCSETSDFKASGWADHLNRMDRVVVCNHQQVEACKASGVTKPVYVVPYGLDISLFQQRYDPIPELARMKQQGDFIFYFVGEAVPRKNLPALLKAFHLEFYPEESVQLVIKTSKDVADICGETRKGLKLGREYKREILITDRLSERDIMRVHASCDCFVMPSYGEAWCYPAIHAMAFGKTPIVSNSTGFKEYLTNAEGWLVDCRDEPVFGVLDTFEDLFVGTETWKAIDVNHLRRCMREAYENAGVREQKSDNGILKAYDFTYPSVGQIFKKVLT